MATLTATETLAAALPGARIPPAHLQPETAASFVSVLDGWKCDEHHARLLTCAAEAWDRMTEARKALDEHGLTYLDRFGAPRTRPEVAIERDSRLAFLRLVTALELDPPKAAPTSVHRSPDRRFHAAT